MLLNIFHLCGQRIAWKLGWGLGLSLLLALWAAAMAAADPESPAPIAAADSPVDAPADAGSMDDLVAACRAQALQHYVADEQVAAEARQVAIARLSDLDQLLRTIGQREAAWRDYLLWPAAQQLTTSLLDDRALRDKLDRRWHVAAEAWKAPQLLSASAAVRALIGQLRARDAQETDEQYAAAWNEIAELLSSLQQGGTIDDRHLAASLEARERLSDAPLLTAAVRQRLARPDVMVQLSRDWIESQFSRVIDEPYAIRGVIAGSRASGAGRMSGQLTVGLVPSDRAGRWTIGFAGGSTSGSTATDRGVVVHSRATTRLQGGKQFELTPEGLSATPAWASAATSIAYGSIDAGGGPIRRRLAVNQTYARQGQAEQESAALAARSLRERLDHESDALVARVNATFPHSLRSRLLDADRLPLTGRITSDAAGIRGEWSVPRWRRLSTTAPPLAGGLTLSVSAAAIEEWLFAALAGRKLNPQELGELLGDLLGRSGEATSAAAQQTLEFAAEPCEVRLHNGELRLVLRLASLETADARYPSASIEGLYQAESRDGRLSLARLGELTVRVAADEPAADGPVSGRRQTLQIALRRALERALGSELTWPTAPVDETSPLGGRSVAAVSADHGWLQIGLAATRR